VVAGLIFELVHPPVAELASARIAVLISGLVAITGWCVGSRLIITPVSELIGPLISRLAGTLGSERMIRIAWGRLILPIQKSRVTRKSREGIRSETRMPSFHT